MNRRVFCRGALSLAAIAGCATAAAPPASPPKPAKAASVQGAPVANGLRVQALAELPDLAPAAWAFLTTDLHLVGHPELVLLVQRAPGEGDEGYPAEGLEIVSSLAKAVKEGRHFKEWEMAGIADGMFGRRDLTGIVMGATVPDARLKVGGPTMTVLLVTQDELDVAFHFGAPRVTNLLGARAKFFPYPPWVDRKRASVCKPADMKASPVAQVETREWIWGAGVWEDLRAQPRRVVFGLTRDASQHAAKLLRETKPDMGVFISLAPADDAGARLVWSPLGEKPLGIARDSDREAAKKLAGVFVVLAASADSSGAMVTEDGFSVLVPKARWGALLAALEAGRPFELDASEGMLRFAITVQGAP